MMVESQKRASEVFRPFKLNPQVKANLKIDEKIPLDDIKGLKELRAKIESKGMRHLFRYSGTENKIRLLLEGEDIKELISGWVE